jgi:hypothetical protein
MESFDDLQKSEPKIKPIARISQNPFSKQEERNGGRSG